MERPFWTLNKLAVLVLMGGFALLLVEIRFLHQHVLAEYAIAWGPIAYCGLMLLAGTAALVGWDRGGRRVLFWAFALGLVVGPLGFWFHNGGQPIKGVEQELKAWTKPIRPHEHGGGGEAEGGEDKGKKESGKEGEGHKHGSDKGEKGKKAGSGEQKGQEKGDEDDSEMARPPALAPLTFFGLGLLGMFVCARRFQQGVARG